MKIEYEDFINGYDPISVSWKHRQKKIKIEFSETITALYSEKLERVVVELYQKGKLNFYALNGNLESDLKIPEMDGYQFRGINKNNKSITGISLLFHPIDSDVGNEWRDTEQYELKLSGKKTIGKRLGIYR